MGLWALQVEIQGCKAYGPRFLGWGRSRSLDLDGTEDVGGSRSGVSVGVPDTTTDDSGSDETGTTDGDTSEGDGREELGDLEGHLLRAVGEVVVTGGHEVEGSSGGRADNTTIEEGGSEVEVVAVLLVLLVVVVVSSGRGVGLAAVGLTGGGADGGLVLVGKLEGKGGLEDLGVVDEVGVVATRLSLGLSLSRLDGDHVGAISLVESVTGLVGGVVVRSSPLEVDVVSTGDLEVVGGEIVLNGGVALDNVSTASTDSQVEDTGTGLNVGGALGDLEGMRAILEGTSELVGVDVEGEVAEVSLSVDSVVDVGVVGDGGLGGSIVGRVDHLSSLLINVGETVVVTRRDVVADTEDASGELGSIVVVDVGDDPLVGLSHQRGGDVDVTEMVIARLVGSEALGRGETPLLDLGPGGSSVLAAGLVPVGGLVGPDLRNVVGVGPVLVGGGRSGGKADVLVLHVLGVVLVVRAAASDRGEDSNILPGSGSPVGVVVALLGALETMTVSVVSVGVLTITDGSGGGITGVLVSKEESSVTTAGGAGVVPGEGLLLSTSSGGQSISSVVGDSSVTIVGSDGVGGTLLSTVTDPGTAHVLKHHVAINVGVVGTATVLDGPLDLEQRALVVGHRVTPLVTSLSVVLRIEQAVLVLGVLVLFIELVVRTTGGVEVAISRGGGQKPSQHQGD